MLGNSREKQREAQLHVPGGAWKRRSLSVKLNASTVLALCLEYQLNGVVGRRGFKITFLYLYNHHVIVEVSGGKPSERQTCYIFHIL